MKISIHSLPFFFLLLALALLPLAQIKTIILGVPLYFPEWCVLAAGGAAWYRFFQSTGKWWAFPDIDRGLLAGLALFCMGASLSFFANPFSLTGLGMLKSWFFFPALFGILLFLELRSVERLRALLLVWFGILCAVAGWSLWLFFSGDLTYDGRLAGEYASPNFLAYFIAPALPLALALLLEGESMISKTGLFRFVVFGGSTLVLITVFLTRSYGVWFALTVAFFLWIFGYALKRGFEWKTLLLFFAPLFFLLALFFLDHESDKWQSFVQNDSRSSLSSRGMIWQAAAMIVRDHPIFGIGPGRFQGEYLEYQKFFPPYLEWAVPEPHNFFLALFLSTGLLGSLGFLLLMGRLIWLLFKHFLEFDRRESILGFLLIALWGAFFAYGLVDTPYFKTDLAYTFFLVWALTAAFAKKPLY